MIRFSCPGCGAIYSVGDEKAGKTGKCPKCQSQFQIPMPEEPSVAAPPPPPPVEEPRPKKPASKADDFDFEKDKPSKKRSSKYDDDDDFDDEDDRPVKKKKSSRYEDEDDDDRPVKKKKSSSKYDDDDDFDFEDDRPAKKSKKKSSRYDDDYDDDYDDYDDDDYDRPKSSRGRGKKKSGAAGLLIAAGVVHILFSLMYLSCGGCLLAGGSMVASFTGAASTQADNNPNIKMDAKQREALDQAETIGTVMIVYSIAAILLGITQIPTAVGCFMKKNWAKLLTFACGGGAVLLGIVMIIINLTYGEGQDTGPMILGIAINLLIPLVYAGFVIFAVTHKSSTKVMS